MRPLHFGPLMTLLISGDTRLVRFWFAVVSFGWAFWLFTDPGFASAHHYAVILADQQKLAILFAVYSGALLYGVVTTRFSTILLLIEGLLGTFLWCGIGIADSFEQHTLGPTFFGGALALFLLVRYPTHYKKGPPYV